ncbi:Cna B-type domain-containing protein [Companilactobacillus crustorum]|uniref:Cna B-type domain-containing protein n=1 Tax=Companilactobacillus crustorum TaxID=392416 RepID=UPI00237EE57D|nr:Cna B-type domain-containing protein [Companilactobacillus crustorum]WDT65377.1 Cna B-type domain-containing protein [Companilactobacillus crustorum]
MFKKGNNIFNLLIIVLSIFMTSSINVVNAAEGTDTPVASQANSDDSTGGSGTAATTPTTKKDWGSQLVTKVQLLNADKKPQSSFNLYEDITAYWEFATPTGGVNEGDTMTFDVPKQLTITGDQKNVPVTELAGGNQIGTASLSKAKRQVTVVFNKYAANKSKNDTVTGSIYVGTRWDTTQVSQNTKVPIDWNVTGEAINDNDSTTSSTVNPDPGQPLDPKELIGKNGTFEDIHGNTIHWVVRVNYKGEKINDAIYKDTIGHDQALLNDAEHPITIYSATPDYTAGTLTEDKTDNKFSDLKATTNANGFTVNFGTLTQPAMIEYYTSITDTDNKLSSYANTGDLLSNKDEISNYTVNQAYTTLGSDARTSDQVTSIMGHKLWQVLPDTKLPDSVTINLIQNGNAATHYAQQTVTADSNWSYAFNNLPKYDSNGNAYKYTVQEVPIDGFVSVSDSTNYDITNISKSIRKDMKVKKVWVDNNNPNRPKQIFVNLYDDKHNNVSSIDPSIKQLTLDDSNNWSGIFKNVPVSPTGHWYYSESIATADNKSSMPAEYFELQKDNSNGARTDITIYNKLATSLTVTKDWNDNNNKNRPTEVKVQLYANDNGEGDKPLGEPVTLNEANHWSHKFGAVLDEDPTKPADPTNKLPKYDDKNKEIKYSAKEVSVPTDYSEKDTIDADGTNETITNTLDNIDDKTTSFKATKVWADNDTVKNHPDVQVQLLANGVASGAPITLSDKTSWSHTWENLPESDDSGAIKYSVKEIKVAGYTSAITYNDSQTQATITNTPTTPAGDKTSLNVQKIWNDNNNKDNLRPDKVVVHLFADNKDTGKSVTLTADNSWKGSFTDLDKGPAYTVNEDSVNNYSTKITKNSDTDFTITNTHTPKTPVTPSDDKTHLNINKVWADNNNKDNLRPDKVVVHLFADNKDTGKSVILNANNKWRGSFTDLDKDKIYTISEDSVSNYSTNITKNSDTDFTITNTQTSKSPVTPTNDKTSLHVTKIWNDNNNEDNIRPNKVIVHLFKNGVAFGDAISLNSQNNWSYTWNNLDKNNNYTVQEDSVAGYTTSQITNSNNIVITNIHTSKTPANPGNPSNSNNSDNPFSPSNPFVPSTPDTNYDRLPQTGAQAINIAYTIIGFIILGLTSIFIFRRKNA